MKFLLVVSLCLFFSFDASAQAESVENKSETGIEEITLSRDDGRGNSGEATEKFSTSDVPIHCFVQLASNEPTTVKMVLVAVKAERLKPESKIVTISYPTKNNQDQVNFDASPNGVWAAGNYRVDIFLDGKLARSKNFEIEKSFKESRKENTVAPKSLAPRKNGKPNRKIGKQSSLLHDYQTTPSLYLPLIV